MILTEDELVGICNAINEVRHGLPKTGVVAEFNQSGTLDPSVEQRLRTALKSGGWPTDVSLTPNEESALRKTIDVVLEEIEDPELHTRLGLSRDELTALRSRLS